MKNLKDVMKSVKEQTKELLKQQGRLVPIIIAFNERECFVLGLDFSSQEAKYACIEEVKRILKEKNVSMYAMICEGWASIMKGVESIDKAREIAGKAIPPSQDPQKKEAIIIQGVDFGNKVLLTIPFKKVGSFIEFEDEVWSEGADVGGHMSDLLDKGHLH